MHQAKRDSRLHNLLKKAAGTKPMGLKTLGTPGLRLRHVPKTSHQKRRGNKSSNNNAPPTGTDNPPQNLTVAALEKHMRDSSSSGGSGSGIGNFGHHHHQNAVPLLNLAAAKTQLRSQRRAKKSKLLQRTMPSVRPSTVASGTDWMDNGPSTLRRRVEAGKRSEWAQIVNKDLQNYREETSFMKEQKKLERKNYASEILNTINLRATLKNPDIEKKEKESWRKKLEEEERSNAIVKRIQMGEEKLKAMQLKQDRDDHVKILRQQKKEEENYHELWNQKIINDAKENILLSAQVKQKKMKEEKAYLQKTMNEHKIAKLKLIEAHNKQLKEEQKLADRHNNKVSGQYVTASETRKRETRRIDLLQTRQMKMGEKWVNRDAEKRIREQEHFANKSNGPAGSGKNYEMKAFKLIKQKKREQCN